jgi:hypothetical protein
VSAAEQAHVVGIYRVRQGHTIPLAPDDRVLYMRSEDDLSLGGEWHTFAVLRPTTPGRTAS